MLHFAVPFHFRRSAHRVARPPCRADRQDKAARNNQRWTELRVIHSPVYAANLHGHSIGEWKAKLLFRDFAAKNLPDLRWLGPLQFARIEPFPRAGITIKLNRILVSGLGPLFNSAYGTRCDYLHVFLKLEHRALARNIVAQPFSMGNKLLGQVSTPNSLPRRFDVRPPQRVAEWFPQEKGGVGRIIL